MLTENEWNTINNMLLELYTIDELDVFTSKNNEDDKNAYSVHEKVGLSFLDDDRKDKKKNSHIFIGFDNDVKRQIHRRFFLQ